MSLKFTTYSSVKKLKEMDKFFDIVAHLAKETTFKCITI